MQKTESVKILQFRRENKEDLKVSYIVIDGEEREAVCPTGAMTIKNETDKAWEILRGDKESTRAVVQIAPAVRVTLGEKFGLARGEDAMGKIVAALKKIGADFVVDAAFAADIVAAREAEELAERMKNGGKLPMFSAACPAWAHYAENRYPDLKEYFSSCRSPMQTFGEGLKKCFAALNDGKETKVIAVVSCAAEKCEEVSEDEIPSVDLVLTTDELSEMFAEEKIRLRLLKNEKADEPFSSYTGAGILTGTAGGVTEAIVRALSEDKSEDAFAKIEYSGIRSRKEFREAEIQVGGLTIKAAVVCGLKAADELAEKIVAGESTYDFVEVSVCPDGCVSGGGQITSDETTEKLRAAGLCYMDKNCALRSPEQNETAMNFGSPEFAAEFVEEFKARTEEVVEAAETVEEEPVEEPTEEVVETTETVEEEPAEEPTEEVVETTETVEEEPAEEPTEEVVETVETVEEEPVEEQAETSEELSQIEGEIAAADDITDDIEEEPLEELFEEETSEPVLEESKDEENVEEILTEQANPLEEAAATEAESEKDTIEDTLEESSETEVEPAEESMEEKAAEMQEAEETEEVLSSDNDDSETEEILQDAAEEDSEKKAEPYHRTLSRKERKKLKKMRKAKH